LAHDATPASSCPAMLSRLQFARPERDVQGWLKWDNGARWVGYSGLDGKH